MGKKYSSSDLNKIIRILNEDIIKLTMEEEQYCKFHAAVGENVEDVRPDYSYSGTAEKVEHLQEKVREIKHAINVFNTTYEISEVGMTIDQVLILLPQMTQKKRRLEMMLRIPDKIRVGSFGSGTSAIIDYEYANFDRKKVQEDYENARFELNRLQTLLDEANAIASIEVGVDI